MTYSRSDFKGKPVLVALDLSERFEACLRQGSEMATKFGQALLLVHVVHETGETTGLYRRNHQTNDTTPLSDIARTMVEERLAAFREADDILNAIRDIRVVVVEGLPETRILELAKRYDASMIVMCSHNRRGMSRWLYGSATESVVRHAPCPVVVVGHGEAPFAPLTIHRPTAPGVTATEPLRV